MMPKYGTKEWFEYYYNINLHNHTDGWKTEIRYSQEYRLNKSLNLIKDFIKGNNNQRILDIGSGQGDFSNKIYLINKKNKVFCCDISKNAIDLCHKKYPHLNSVVLKLPDLKYQKNYFDVVVALEVIYYLNNKEREKGLQRIKNITKVRGIVLISVVISNSRRYFSEKEIIKLFEKYFKTTRIIYLYNKIYHNIEIFALRLINYHEKLLPIRKKNLIYTFKYWLLYLPVIFSRITLKSKFVFNLCSLITKLFAKNTGKTQIILLGQKMENNNV